MKNLFDQLQGIMAQLDTLEGGLKSLRDHVDVKVKKEINGTLVDAIKLRDGLWKIDKALELEAEAAKAPKKG